MKNNNKENKELPKLGRNGRVAGLVFSFVAMIALVGAFTFTQYEEDAIDEIAEITEEEISQEATPLEIASEDVGTEEGSNEIVADATEEVETDLVVQETTELEVAELEQEEVAVTTNSSVQDQIAFGNNDTMIWPITGDTIMWYSMDQAIYFETLNQYKLNNAMIIAGEVGTEVLAGEIGFVESIVEDAETGTTITVDLGNGYSVVYGQLTDIRVTEGSMVEQGQIIGVLAEPSKYYSLEGCNLYLQVWKDGETVDPLLYLE